MIDKDYFSTVDCFIDNKYLDEYIALINKNCTANAIKFFTQKHHIIPVAAYKLLNIQVDNSASNLVNLAYKDHIYAHYLLANCVDDRIKPSMTLAMQYLLGHAKHQNAEIYPDLITFVSELAGFQELYVESKKHISDVNKVKLTGHEVSEEARRKISLAHTGKVLSEETRKKISIAHKNKPLADATKQKISESLLGVPKPFNSHELSEEHKTKISAANAGREVSQETRTKISKANTGKAVSLETRAKISKANLGKKAWNTGMPSNIKGKIAVHKDITVKYILPEKLPEYLANGFLTGNGRHPNTARPTTKVICLETNIIYASQKEARLITGLSGISQALRNYDKGYTAGGYHWAYCIDLPIIGFEEGDNRHVGRLGAVLVEYKGNVVKVGSGFSDELRTSIWEHKDDWLGRTIVVQYFEETTNQNGGISLRFPVYLDYRTDK